MTLEQSRACLDRAEESLREAAGHLVQSPLDPGNACIVLERARVALEAVRERGVSRPNELGEAVRSVRREAARVQALLEAAAALWFRYLSAGMSTVSYTAAGEVQADRQPGRFAFQG